MSPASGPVNDPKLHPAAAMEDQELVEGGGQTPVVLGTPPFSSPNPETDGLKMLPLEDGTSAYEARQESAALNAAADEGDYSKMSKDDLKALAESRGLDTEGLKKADLVASLQEDDTSDMKASDFKASIDAATTQAELDAAVELYEASGKEYSSVEAAVEKKQGEINDASSGGSGS